MNDIDRLRMDLLKILDARVSDASEFRLNYMSLSVDTLKKLQKLLRADLPEEPAIAE